jgi:hypothetical protein
MTTRTYKISLEPLRVDVEGNVVAKYFGIREDTDGWAIDHIPSGMRVGVAKSRSAAIRAARRIATMGDWTRATLIPSCAIDHKKLEAIRDELNKMKVSHA